MAEWVNRKIADKLTAFSKFADLNILQGIEGITDNLEGRVALQRLAG